MAKLLALCLAFSAVASGQTSTGSISGNVRDQSQATVANARITLTNTGRNESRSATSNKLGYYSFQLLPPAAYRLEVEAPGFKRFVRENVALDVAVAAVIDVELQLGTSSETVTVTASAPQLDSGSSSLGQVIENKTLIDLPINGRNSYGFAALVPGVRASALFTQVAYASYNDQFVSINGSRVNANQFYLDGGANSTAGFNGPGLFPSVDLVQEYKVQTNNFSAEFGNTAGGVINVITKSGTNQLHGSLYDFLRNNRFDANDFFANRGGIPKAELRFNQFGAAAGGPVQLPKIYDGKDRTFFFFSYEGLRWVRALTTTGTMPTDLQRAGDFSQTRNQTGAPITIYDPVTSRPDPAKPGAFIRSPFPGNVIPRDRMDPVALALLNYTPHPNTAGTAFTGTNNFVTSLSALTQKDTFSIRGDHSLTQNQKIFMRFGLNDTTVNRPHVYGPDYIVSEPVNGTDILHHRQAVLNYNWVVNPTTVVELSSSVLHYWLGRKSGALGFNPVKLGLPSYYNRIPFDLCFPTVAVAGLGVTINVVDNGGGFLASCNHTDQSYDTFHEYGNVTKVNGAHTFKMGADFGSNRWTQRTPPASSNFTFGTDMTQGPNPLAASSTGGVGFASFLLGAGTSGNVRSDIPGQFISYHYYGLYFQDDWKFTPRLTFNLGIRYDFNAPWTDKRNRINSWNGNTPSPLQIAGLNLHGGLQFPGVNGLPRGQFDNDRTNFAPRVGFAYAADSKTVVRAGFGIFFGPINGAAFTSNSTPNSGFNATTPWLTSIDGITPTNYLSNPFPTGFQKAPGSSQGLLTFLGQDIVTMDRGRQTPYQEQWNIGFQRTLPKNFLLDMAYAGSHGNHLFGPLNYDQLPDQYLALGDNLRTLVANPFYGIVTTGALSASTVQLGQLLRPYPQFNSVIATTNSYGNSIYHALQAKLERRFTRGFSLLVSYTYSKLIDDVLPSTANLGFAGESFSLGNIQDYYNRRTERAVASFDTPHFLAINGNWELPFGNGKALLNRHGWVDALAGGWQLNGIATMHSGAPLGLTTVTNTARNYGSAQRPNYLGGDPEGHGPIADRLNQYFNAAAFAVPAPYTYGNTARLLSWLRAPGVGNLDLSVFKDIPVHERMRLQFRFEVFNVMNHPQFDFPNTSIGAPQAGVIAAQANQPRDIQLALKFLF
ncbi:MAG: carboxypeptidase regulatory-like domain-containing protein [Bryobacteraceae bacterium]